MEFIKSLFFLFSGSETLSKHKKSLQQLGKEITRNKYHQFYGVKSAEIRQQCGMFFYDMYKALYSTGYVVQHAEKSAILREIIIEYFLSKELLEAHNRLAPESIEERAKSISHHDLSHQVEETMNTVSSGIKRSAVQINRCYQLMVAFIRFARFDFFSCLQRFDSHLREGNFIAQPQLRAVNGKYVVSYIKNFLALPSLEAKPEEWKPVFDILKKYKASMNMIGPNQWRKLLLIVQDVFNSRILMLMVQHIEQNPEWDLDAERIAWNNTEDIVTVYLRDKTAAVKSCLNKLMHDTRFVKQNALAKQLFGNPDITRLQYYTTIHNEVFIKKNLDGFVYIPTLNYMKAFFTDRQDILDLCDMLMIRGQWTSRELSLQSSQGLHEITDISEQLTVFDESLSDNGVYGTKLKTYLNRSAVDTMKVTNLKAVLNQVNDQAKELITHGIRSFTTVGVLLKRLHDDYTARTYTLLINWNELDSLSELPIVQRVEQGYQFIDDFVSLLRLFVSEDA